MPARFFPILIFTAAATLFLVGVGLVVILQPVSVNSPGAWAAPLPHTDREGHQWTLNEFVRCVAEGVPARPSNRFRPGYWLFFDGVPLRDIEWLDAKCPVDLAGVVVITEAEAGFDARRFNGGLSAADQKTTWAWGRFVVQGHPAAVARIRTRVGG